jgi:hypothetical protein
LQTLKVLLGCKLELQRQIIMPPVIGYGMLEPDAVKVVCLVLKGLEAGNGLRLLNYLDFVTLIFKSIAQSQNHLESTEPQK